MSEVDQYLPIIFLGNHVEAFSPLRFPRVHMLLLFPLRCLSLHWCLFSPLLIYSQRSEMSTNQIAVWSDLFLGLGKFQAHWDKRIWACLKGMGNMSGMSKGMPRMSEDIRKHVWNASAWMETQSLLMRNIECSKKKLPLGNASSLVEKIPAVPRITEGSMSLPHFWLRRLRQNSFSQNFVEFSI